jgi:ribosome maturation factor RimP
MVSDEQLNEWRVETVKIRVIRDAVEANDLKGIIVAWDDETVIIRKQNRKVVKLPRTYVYQPFDMDRPDLFSS